MKSISLAAAVSALALTGLIVILFAWNIGLILVLDDLTEIGLIALAVASAFVIAVLVPGLLLLQHLHKLTFSRFFLFGLATAGSVAAILEWDSELFLGPNPTNYLDAIPTHQDALLGYLTFVGQCGFVGAMEAAVLLLTWRRMGPNNSFKPNPLRGSA